MIKRSWIFSLIILSCSGLKLNAQILNSAYKQIVDSLHKENVALLSIEDFKKLNKQQVYVLDVREEEEFEVSHIKNGRHVGYIWFDMRKVYDIPLDAKIIVYCSVGFRSEKIAKKLINHGYKNVFNLYGGIFEWVNQGNPVYTSDGVQTSAIHTYDKEWAPWVNRGMKVN